LDFIKTKKVVCVRDTNSSRVENISYKEYASLLTKMKIPLKKHARDFRTMVSPHAEIKYLSNPKHKLQKFDEYTNTTKIPIGVRKGVALCKTSMKDRRRDFESGF
jgi:hypothetical protein